MTQKRRYAGRPADGPKSSLSLTAHSRGAAALSEPSGITVPKVQRWQERRVKEERNAASHLLKLLANTSDTIDEAALVPIAKAADDHNRKRDGPGSPTDLNDWRPLAVAPRNSGRVSKPKRAKHAYEFFQMDVREKVMADVMSTMGLSNPNSKFVKGKLPCKVNKALAKLWNTLKNHERDQYQKRASEDRQRYRNQMDEQEAALGLVKIISAQSSSSDDVAPLAPPPPHPPPPSPPPPPPPPTAAHAPHLRAAAAQPFADGRDAALGKMPKRAFPGKASTAKPHSSSSTQQPPHRSSPPPRGARSAKSVDNRRHYPHPHHSTAEKSRAQPAAFTDSRRKLSTTAGEGAAATAPGPSTRPPTNASASFATSNRRTMSLGSPAVKIPKLVARKPVKRRKRLHLACVHCVTRKMKCEGGFPCTRCRKSNIEYLCKKYEDGDKFYPPSICAKTFGCSRPFAHGGHCKVFK
eukprot:jgi/Bigna1/82789/fgenesh1_pg.97_\